MLNIRQKIMGENLFSYHWADDKAHVGNALSWVSHWLNLYIRIRDKKENVRYNSVYHLYKKEENSNCEKWSGHGGIC